MIGKKVIYSLWISLFILFSGFRGDAGIRKCKERMQSIILPDFVIYEHLQTFDEVMEGFQKQIRESDPLKLGVNIVVLPDLKGGKQKSDMGSYSSPKSSAYDILTDLQFRGDLQFRIEDNLVVVAPAGVPLKKMPAAKITGDCRKILKKMDEIIFPVVSFDMVHMDAAVQFMRQFAGEKVRISVAKTAGKEDNDDKYITLSLRNATLKQLLECICLLTGASYMVEPEKIWFVY